jgi:hypothetical protein
MHLFVGQPSSVVESLTDILSFQVGVLTEDFGSRLAVGDKVEYKRDSDAETANACTPPP